jgi:GNAT superfamily N-acetyltransferase
MEIRIRRGRRTDYEALSALCAWPMVDESPARSTRLFRNTVSDLAYDLYVADDGGLPIGLVAVSYVRVLPLGGQRATLEELVVRPDRRGAGIGRRLLEFAVGRARRRGARAFEAQPTDEAAARFLDHVGFRLGAPQYARSLAEDSS